MTTVDIFVIGGAFLFGIFTGAYIFVVLHYLNNLEDFEPRDPIEIRRQHREAFLKQHHEMKGE